MTKKTDNSGEAFGWPNGTVRAILAFLWAVGFFVLVWLKSENEILTAVLGITAIITGFYFNKGGSEYIDRGTNQGDTGRD